jgi:hypothetical protein
MRARGVGFAARRVLRQHDGAFGDVAVRSGIASSKEAND